MSAWKVGIIGGGFMARTHTAAARAAGAEVVSVISSSPESTEQAAQQLAVSAASSVEQLIDSVDVVHICSPNGWHAEHVQQVIAAGRHVVCEKPLALSGEQSANLVEQAERAAVVATVPFVYRFHPMARNARSLAQHGDLGRLLTVRGAYLQDWMHHPESQNWRVDPQAGGPSRAFADIGSHITDLLEFISGERIVRLSAQTSIAYPQRGGQDVTTEDAAVLNVQMSSGAIGSLMVSQVNAGRKNALTLELAGSMSNVYFDQEHPDELWVGGPGETRILSREITELSADAHRLSLVPAGHPMGYMDAFSSFARDTYARINGESPPGLPTFADGARANQLIDAVLLSAQTGQWVDTAVPQHSLT